MSKVQQGNINAYLVANLTKWKQEKENINALVIVNNVMLVQVTDSRVKYIVANIKIKKKEGFDALPILFFVYDNDYAIFGISLNR